MLDQRKSAMVAFHNQVSLKSHDVCHQNAILHVNDSDAPLRIANTIGKESKISSVFPWPSNHFENRFARRKIIAGIKF